MAHMHRFLSVRSLPLEKQILKLPVLSDLSDIETSGPIGVNRLKLYFKGHMDQAKVTFGMSNKGSKQRQVVSQHLQVATFKMTRSIMSLMMTPGYQRLMHPLGTRK